MRIITREFWCTPIDFVWIGFGLYIRRRWPVWVALLVLGKAAQLAGPGGALVGFAIILAAMFLPALLWLRLASLARRPENRTFYLPRMMEIDDHGFFVQARQTESASVAWTAVATVSRAHQGHLIRTRDGRSFYVPDYAFACAADRALFEGTVANAPIGRTLEEAAREEERVAN